MDLHNQRESIQDTIPSDEDNTENRQIIDPPVQQEVLVLPGHERKSYPTDLTDAQWERIVPLVPPAEPNGQQKGVELREVINAILYVACDSYDWRSFPDDLPPRSTVYHYFQQWRRDGTWQKMLDALQLEVIRYKVDYRFVKTWQKVFDALDPEEYEANGHEDLPGATPGDSVSGEPQSAGLLSDKDDIGNIASIEDDLTVVIPTREEPLMDIDDQRGSIQDIITADEDITEKCQIFSPPVQQAVLVVPEHERKSYPTDLTDAQWERIVPLMLPAEPKGRQNGVQLREIINGILYVDCDSHDWQSLPHDLPPRKTVYHYFRLWRRDGTWQKILDALHPEAYEANGHEELPGATPGDSVSGEAQPAGLLSEKDAVRNITPISDDLTVVIPTRNERDNIMPLLHALRAALDGIGAEILFVDDSDDDTPEVIKDASLALETSMFHVHVEHRQPGSARAGGLATAVVHGMNRAQAAYVAVIDADLQHPPEQLRVLYDKAVAQHVDLVVASRYIKGGSYGGLAGVGRRCVSIGLKWTARLLFPGQLLRISDPLGGFFLLHRSLLADVSLRPIGYKVLLEILLRCPWRHVLEVPYHFQARAAGQSKATMQQGMLALRHMLRLWREVPAAGRIWKISLLLLLNGLITLALFIVNNFSLSVWANLNTVVFGVMACLDFVLFNRFIFPSPIVTGSVAPSTPSLVSTEDSETVELPSPQEGSTNGHHLSSFDDSETVKLPLLRDASTNGSHPSAPEDEAKDELPAIQSGSTNGSHPDPIDDSETVKLPLLRDASTNGHHLSSIEDRETVELPSTELAVASAIDLKRKSQPTRKSKFYDRFPSVAAVAAVILAVGWISYARPGAILVLAVLFIGLAIAFTKNVNREQAITMMLGIAVGVATIDYLSWRVAATNWHGWWIAVPLLCAEALGALHVLGFQFTIWPWSPPEIEQREDPTQHPIFIFIPTVNEGVAILRPTLEGIIAARDKYLAQYPHGRVTIVVCNDGRVAKAANWEEIDLLAQELGVRCVTRTERGGAKAGNIENARHELQATGDALLVIFDADQVAKPDFLLKTIPPFGDPKMGWVQTGQYYANLDNPVSRWADDQQSMFYNLLCPGKAALNAAFICGTNVVIRAAALDEIGGLPQDSVTEDFAASIALHPSWRSIYLTDILATGLGPLDVPSYLKQQGRWALGTLGVLRTHWREILLPKKHGLRMGQRVQYFLACTHYLCGLRDLIYLLSPMLFIFTRIPAVRSTYLSEYLWHFLPYALLGAVALWYAARGVTGLRGIIIGFGSFPVLIGSLLSVILRRRVGFAVTSKQRGRKRSLSYLWVYLFFLVFCVACLFWATQIKGQEQTSLFISILWVVYSMVILSSFLWLNFKDLRFQAAVQQSQAPDEAIDKQPYPSKLLQRKRGLHPVWNLGLAALVAAPILASNSLDTLSLFAGSPPSPFVISQEKIAAPYFGVSLPIQLLKKRPPVLESELGTQFSIIGRTQDIHDLFDTTWANQLAAQHARPWITLQFGVFGPDRKPPLDGNLPAIINGLHDQELRRWAQDIRRYGKPVYLTVLQHADRNWSLSSGVANGGIPEDIPKAWMRVQAVFRAVGATNVAWVWAPADPLNDQPYAPPASTIDAVLQSFINYPGTTWGDPKTILQNLVQRYPGKPIFVEASVNGPAAQKAPWLTRLGQAVDDTPQVYALLYHEGGPGLDPSNADIESWSLASDLDSLAVMRSIVAGLHTQALVRSY